MKRNGHADELVQFAMAERGKDKPLTEVQRKNFLPKMDEMIAFLESRPDVWGATTGNYVKQSMRKLASYQTAMNTALHNPYQGCHRSVVFQIRDEVGPALRHLIEHPWPAS